MKEGCFVLGRGRFHQVEESLTGQDHFETSARLLIGVLRIAGYVSGTPKAVLPPGNMGAWSLVGHSFASALELESLINMVNGDGRGWR